MSSNDAIVLQANFAQWRTRATGLTGMDPWVYFCIEQFVKQYELSDEEIQDGYTEGGHDGGADAIFFIINHRIAVREETAIDPRVVTSARVIFFQVKETAGFQPTEIDKHIELAKDFFNFSSLPETLSFRYNDNVIKKLRLFRETYLKTSGNNARVDVNFYYVTGSDVESDEHARDSGNRVTTSVEALLSGSVCIYHFIAAPQLWEQVQKRAPKDKMLHWTGTPMETVGGYVGLVKLNTFYEFLQDQPGVLAERLFESNVRGYQGASPVNTEIKHSLEYNDDGVNFWLLNNGITIIAANTTSAGYLLVNIQDPQIVNGLQTSREIFNFCNSGDRSADERSVLVRVVKITDSATQDLVIKATNSQNQMAQSALRMTDQIHRDIENLLTSYDLYYDRRKGYYKDQGRPIAKIISVNLVAQAMIAIVLQRPDDARARPGDYFKSDPRYRAIFEKTDITLPVYVKCILLMRRIEKYLAENRVKTSDAKNIKFHMATDLSCELTKGSRIWPAKLLEMPDPIAIHEAVVAASFTRVNGIYERLAAEGAERDAIARGADFLQALLMDIRIRFPPLRRRAPPPSLLGASS